MWPPQTRYFSTRKPRKGKSKKGGLGLRPTPSAPAPPPPPPPAPATPLKAPPSNLFPRYSSSTFTPLPPPSMPKQRFLRRALPFLVAATAGAYMLRGNLRKEMVEKSEGTGEDVSSVKAETM